MDHKNKYDQLSELSNDKVKLSNMDDGNNESDINDLTEITNEIPLDPGEVANDEADKTLRLKEA